MTEETTDIETLDEKKLLKRITNLTKGAIGDQSLAIGRMLGGILGDLEVQKLRAEYVEQRMNKCPSCGAKIDFKQRMVALSDEFDELRAAKSVKGKQEVH